MQPLLLTIHLRELRMEGVGLASRLSFKFQHTSALHFSYFVDIKTWGRPFWEGVHRDRRELWHWSRIVAGCCLPSSDRKPCSFSMLYFDLKHQQNDADYHRAFRTRWFLPPSPTRLSELMYSWIHFKLQRAPICGLFNPSSHFPSSWYLARHLSSYRRQILDPRQTNPLPLSVFGHGAIGHRFVLVQLLAFSSTVRAFSWMMKEGPGSIINRVLGHLMRPESSEITIIAINRPDAYLQVHKPWFEIKSEALSSLTSNSCHCQAVCKRL